MDTSTLRAYDRDAAAYCDEWLNQPPGEDMQQLWRRYFAPGRPSADIGSGSGRDVAWLNRNGYPCEGWDASAGLVAEARRHFPQLRFAVAGLPELEGVPAAAYANVVCETVIMHLPRAQIARALDSLLRILAPGGTLYLSWRISPTDVRDAAGRLYSAFTTDAVRAALEHTSILYDAEELSASSGKRVHRLVVRRLDAS